MGTPAENDRKPARRRSATGVCAALLGTLLSAVYLLNFTLGIIEIPDNLPFVGNLDEVVVSGIFFGCLRDLGIDLVPFPRNHGRKKTEESRTR